MREDELRQFAKCIVCGQGIGQAGSPMFFTLTLERYVVNLRAIRQQQGLGEFFGGGEAGHKLASIMGADPEMAHKVGGPVKRSVCMGCLTHNSTLCVMLEAGLEDTDKKERKD